MNRVWNWLTMAIFVMMFGCSGDRCDVFGGTQESKNKAYKGDPGAAGAYLDVNPKLWIMNGTCDSMGCTYFVTVTSWFHNPTTSPVKADVVCKLKFPGGSHTNGDTTVSSEYIASKNSRKGVVVKPKASKEIKIQHNISAQNPTQLVPDCELVFK
jgi:hypothetical protein